METILVSQPKLPPKTADLFYYFTRQANKSLLHPLDWQRFYEFVQASHEFRVKLNETELGYLLEKEGFSEEYASRIADVYYHIREFLKGSRRRNYKRRYFPSSGLEG